MDLLAQYASSDDSDDADEETAAGVQGPLNSSRPGPSHEKKSLQDPILTTTENTRPKKRLKSAVGQSAVDSHKQESMKKSAPETGIKRVKYASSSILMFAPPQLLRKTPNESTEDLDKWNSAGLSKHRKLASVRAKNK